MRLVKHKVYTDSDFPNHLFVDTGKGICVYKAIHPAYTKQRGIHHYYLNNKNGLRKALSEQRIEAAIELQRDVLDIRYVSKNRCYRVKSNAYLLALIKAAKELQAEHPESKFTEYLDDAYIRIIESGYIPNDYDDIKSILVKQCLAVKYDREHKITNYDKVAYKIKSEDEEL